MPWYEVSVEGRLGPEAGTVPGFRVVEHRARTVLCGHVDQPSDLPGLLAEVQAQGLEVTEVHQVTSRERSADAERPEPETQEPGRSSRPRPSGLRANHGGRDAELGRSPWSPPVAVRPEDRP
jgi:hypothetical protein